MTVVTHYEKPAGRPAPGGNVEEVGGAVCVTSRRSVYCGGSSTTPSSLGRGSSSSASV